MTPEELIDVDDVYIPEGLVNAIDSKYYKRDEMEDTCKLIWAMAYDRNSSRGTYYSPIHKQQMLDAGLGNRTIPKAKIELERMGYLEVEKYKNGQPLKKFSYKTNSRLRERRAISYHAVTKGEQLVPTKLKTKKAESILVRKSDDHPVSKHSVECQNLLEINGNRISGYCNQIESILPVNTDKLDEAERSRNQRTRTRYRNLFRTISRGLAYSHKAQRCERVFSTWCFSPKDSRTFFTLDGSSLTGRDLQCSQATLLANMTDDNALLESCFNNRLYGEIIELLELSKEKDPRKKAKSYFFWMLFGKMDLRWNPNKTKEEKDNVGKVQQMFKNHYPKTYEYMKRKKTNEPYENFAIEMQNHEAELFLGIYSDLIKRQIPSLMIHDSIWIPTTFAEDTEEIMYQHLYRAMPNGKFVLEAEH